MYENTNLFQSAITCFQLRDLKNKFVKIWWNFFRDCSTSIQNGLHVISPEISICASMTGLIQIGFPQVSQSWGYLTLRQHYARIRRLRNKRKCDTGPQLSTTANRQAHLEVQAPASLLHILEESLLGGETPIHDSDICAYRKRSSVEPNSLRFQNDAVVVEEGEGS